MRERRRRRSELAAPPAAAEAEAPAAGFTAEPSEGFTLTLPFARAGAADAEPRAGLFRCTRRGDLSTSAETATAVEAKAPEAATCEADAEETESGHDG